MSAPRRRASLLVPSVVAVAAFATLIALGTWQIQRKAWKEGLIEALTQRVNAAPVALSAQGRWNGFDAANDEFRRVTFRAAFIHTQEAYVYAVSSALRPDISGPGYWVFTPAKLADGNVIVVNRGFIPQDKLDTHTRGEGQVLEAVEIVGALRWPEVGGWFTPNAEPQHNVWYARDHLAMAAAKGWGEVAPFYVDQEAPVPPGGLPLPRALTVRLRNDHLQYALTWYGLAGVLVVVFAIWARNFRRAESD